MTFTPEEYSTDSAGDGITGEPVIEELHGTYHHFDEDYSNKQDYLKNVPVFAGTVIAVGVLLMLILWLYSICFCCSCCCVKCCFGCFKGKPKKARCTVIVMFLLSGILATCSWEGRRIFLSAVDKSAEDLDYLAKIFDAFATYSGDIKDDGGTYTQATERANCQGTGAEAITASLNAVAMSVTGVGNALVGLTDGLGDKIRKGADAVADETPQYITLGLGLITALVWVNFGMGSFAIMTSCCKFDDCISMILGSATLLLLIVMVSLEYSIATFMSDFCYPGPTISITETVNNKLLNYFMLCLGTSPLASNFDSARQSITDFTTTLKQIEDDPLITCTKPGGLTLIETTNTELTATITGFENEAGCPTINPLFTSVLNDILCGDFVRGLYVCFVVHAAAGLMLWLTYMVFPCAATTKAVKKDEEVDNPLPGKDVVDVEPGVQVSKTKV